MTGAGALLADLHARGVSVWPSGSNLRLRAPPGALTEELRATIAEGKPGLLAHLSAEVEWRIAAMSSQARRTLPPGFWPLLVAKTGPVEPSGCRSCGEPLAAADRDRCALCLEAARRVIADARRETGLGARPDEQEEAEGKCRRSKT